MAKLKLDISMSLDGYIAAPEQTLEDPLGKGGMRLHEWVFGLKSFRERHGMSGGETNADDEIVAETVRGIGAVVMGRKMFSGGAGPWEADPNADAWWGDDPPFRVPVFVLTHHEREPLVKQGGTTFTFVTDGIESALEQARAAAGAERHLARRRRQRRAAVPGRGSPGRTAGPRRAGAAGRRCPPLRRLLARPGRAGSGEGGGVARRHPSPLPCRPLETAYAASARSTSDAATVEVR